jgi:hypothetical protein
MKNTWDGKYTLNHTTEQGLKVFTAPVGGTSLRDMHEIKMARYVDVHSFNNLFFTLLTIS